MTAIITPAGSQRGNVRTNLNMDPIEPQIHEALIKQNDDWLYFSKPYRIISVRMLEGILPALREIERMVNSNGWHAAGLLSYEAAPAFDRALVTHSTRIDALRTGGFPLLWFGLYPTPRIISMQNTDSVFPSLSWSPTADQDAYLAAIDKIKSHIARGYTYQVNYTMRMKTDFDIDPWLFFLHLANSQNNHGAYIDIGDYVIASASPELFFELDGTTITCRPMKGTVKRGRTTFEDGEKAAWLQHSEKNRAENVMIVDMIRNDLGRIAGIGSVSVPRLFTLEKYPTLWQMTSTVQADTSASLTDIIGALFPSASITGAPKISTMRIISELETTPRQIYTGSIGYISPQRKAVFSVAIRTTLIEREMRTAEYGVGGGIVWDSTGSEEYDEALLKARVLTEPSLRFSLLETLLWTPVEGYFLRDKHISRLCDSAEYFDFQVSEEQLEGHLDQIASRFMSPQRVRLLLDRNGNVHSEAQPFNAAEELPILKVRLAKRPVNSENIFLFHKTTHRVVYDTAREGIPDQDDVLLYNERGELTEFTLGNLVVKAHGKLYTPPVSSGLLAGTFRKHLIESNQVEEKVIRLDELNQHTEVFLVNSIRKWQKVEFG